MITGDGSMSASDSRKSQEDGSHKPRLSSLRARFTDTPSPAMDDVVIKSSRFREEERIRATLRRDKRIRQQALGEKLSLMQDNMARELTERHEMTLDALERELRTEMENEIEQLE